MAALNSLQKTQIRRAVGLVRRLQGQNSEVNDRVRHASKLRNEIRTKLERTQIELEEMQRTSGLRDTSPAELAKAAKYVRSIEQELKVFEDELDEASAQQKALTADLRSAQPVAERLVKLIDINDPTRRLFSWTEDASFEVAK